jgi:hypothetical protein
MGRHPVLTVLMVIFGIILLLPGICAVVFMAGGGTGSDSVLILLWAACFLVSLGGIWLLVKAFR